MRNQDEILVYDELGPMICTPLVQATNPRIFLQQRLQIDEKYAILWYRIDDHGNLHDTLVVEPEKNEVDTMLIHIKDLSNSTPLQNLMSREHNLIDYSCEPTCSIE
jgi:hypothetical protein